MCMTLGRRSPRLLKLLFFLGGARVKIAEGISCSRGRARSFCDFRCADRLFKPADISLNTRSRVPFCAVVPPSLCSNYGIRRGR